MTDDHREPSDLGTQVTAILGRDAPEDSEAWACAVESLEHAAEADRLFDTAETLPDGEERTRVLQDAHDAMRHAASWEQEAVAGAGRPDPSG